MTPRRSVARLPAAVVAVALLVASAPLASASAADATGPGRDATSSEVAAERTVADAARSGRLIVTTEDGRHLTHEVRGRRDARTALAALEASPGVAAVEADQIVSATQVLGTLLDPLRQDQWELDRVEADVTHDVGIAGEGTVIAILDTGVLRTHPDLQANVLPGYDAIARVARPDVGDANGHGTLSAGTAAAAGNDIGGRGIAHQASILPVKVLGDDGNGNVSDVADGLDWAVANGADVVNLSLAGPKSMAIMDAAIVDATDAGVVVVASAGNDGAGANTVAWPAAHPDTVAVGATVSGDAIASFSSSGAHLTVSAPGNRVLGTSVDQNRPYRLWSGTSAAAPITSGALAAAIQAQGTDLSSRTDVEDLVAALTSTVDDVGPKGWDPSFGHGIVRVDRLVAAVGNGGTTDPEPTPAPETDPQPTTDPTPAPTADPEPTPEPQPEPTAPQPSPTKAFTDVPRDNTHHDAIYAIRDAGVTEGCGGGRYCPQESVTRGQMATFLVRALDLPLRPYQGTFSDVPASHTHARAIEALARAKVTGGCGGDRYCPGDDVRRDQMASFLARAYRLSVPSDTAIFSDVHGGTHAPNIAAVAAAKITGGCGGDRYCPGNDVRRDQMASFIARAMKLRG